MTAVLSATDALRREKVMVSLDDDHSNYAVDWRKKYNEVADMLTETRAELDDFHHSSKELEEELERELERTEKAQQDLRTKVAKAEIERDEWKSKFMSLQTTHNTTTTSLQRELDKLRQEYQVLKVQFRELEMGNDDLERNERAVTSSLADVEAKYTRALEEKILLEHELLDKANIEEEYQRLKDELRDANVEVEILKVQLAATQAVTSSSIDKPKAPGFLAYPSGLDSDDNLLSTAPPPDLQLSELEEPLVTSVRLSSKASPVSEFHRPGSQPRLSSTLFARPSVLPAPQSRVPPLPPVPRLPTPVGSATGMPVPTTMSRNKGVQMVSEMRARVRNLEQKIHTRVPRLRMGSTSRPSVKPTSVLQPTEDAVKPRATSETVFLDKSKKKVVKPASDASGWVLIMEDSPSPTESKLSETEKDRARRRVSSPTRATVYRPMSSASSTSNTSDVPLYDSAKNMILGSRIPHSRHSEASTGSSSGMQTPSSASASRPHTPTHPSGLSSPTFFRASSTTGPKRSMGNHFSNLQFKRTSMGSSISTEKGSGRGRLSAMGPPPLPRTSMTPTSTLFSSSTSTSHRERDPLSLSTNSTIRMPSSSSAYSQRRDQSRIGRLTAGTVPSTRDSDLSISALSGGTREEKGELRRTRSGTTSSVYSFRKFESNVSDK